MYVPTYDTLKIANYDNSLYHENYLISMRGVCEQNSNHIFIYSVSHEITSITTMTPYIFA